ncbi:hypothetical protein OAH34_01020 [bacterium]|nr:hypothetical protein [bacterium]
MNGKAKSTRRFEALRHLRNSVIPTLPGPSHAHVLRVCWEDAYTTDDNVQQFDTTKDQIAAVSLLHPRTVQRCLSELEKGGVILTKKVGEGNRGSVRIITGHPYRRGDAPPPQAHDRGGVVSHRGGVVSHRGGTRYTLSEQNKGGRLS